MDLLEKKGERDSVSLTSTHNTIICNDTKNVTGGGKSSLNRELNPGPLAYNANALTTEVLRPDMLINSHTPVNTVTLS